MKKKYDKAEELLAKAEKSIPGNSSVQFYKALLFAAKGDRDKALSLRKNGVVYSLLGMKNKAIKYINDETKKGSEHFQYLYLPLINSAFYESLSDDARFQDIVKKQKKKYEKRLKKYSKL